MGGTPASRNLRAKTGTMDGVSALSGMVRTRSGERILFSILSNEVASEFRAKRAEDRVGARLASLSRPLQVPLPLP
jgi:D-alanyl-D-alanine carboxypeptidase/D-alanyl-D-alanine-endopeptidase (penicillin-binding protein 4)